MIDARDSLLKFSEIHGNFYYYIGGILWKGKGKVRKGPSEPLIKER